MEKDVMLDENMDLKIVDGDFVVDKSLTQEVSMLLRLNKGDLKSDPILGTNLIEKIKQKVSKVLIKQVIDINLTRDGKDFSDLDEFINLIRK